MGMLDILKQGVGMLGNPNTQGAIAYLQARRMGMNPMEAMSQWQQMNNMNRRTALWEEQMRQQEEDRKRQEEERGKAQGQDIINRAIFENISEKGMDWLGPTPEQQMAGLMQRGVDPQTAQLYIKQQQQGKPTKLGERVDPDGNKWVLLQNPDGTREEVNVGLQRESERSQYYQPIMTSQGVASFDARTGRTSLSPGGEGVIPLPQDPEQRAALESAQAWAKTDQAFEVAMQDSLPSMERAVIRLEDLITKVESGDAKTGLVMGNIYKFTDPETALLEVEAILRTVEALQTAKLAPVTEKEFAQMKSMFAQADRTKTVNKALLDLALKNAKSALMIMQDKDAYFRDAGTLKGWRPPSFRKRGSFEEAN